MRLIIAGGRDFKPVPSDARRLTALMESLKSTDPIEQVVCGGATGADQFGKVWALEHGIPVKEYPAYWKSFGASGGSIRNIEMANNADGAVLFPGGKGTQHMFEMAKTHGLKVWDWRNTEAQDNLL